MNATHACLRLLPILCIVLPTAVLSADAPAAIPVGAPAEPPRPWTADVAFGLTGTKGNADNILTTLAVNADLKTDAHAVDSGIEGAYGKTAVELADGTSEKQTNTQRLRAFGNYKRRVNQWHTYADGSINHDDIADVRYRTILGVGAGRFLVDRESADLFLEGGVGYIWEEVADERDRAPTLRAAERSQWTISPTAKLWQSVEWSPRIEDLQDYLLLAEVGLDVMINSRLSVRLTLTDSYDSTPAPDKKRNALALVSALALKL
jgi:putative salt-induced outer membrane protein YdiY